REGIAQPRLLQQEEVGRELQTVGDAMVELASQRGPGPLPAALVGRSGAIETCWWHVHRASAGWAPNRGRDNIRRVYQTLTRWVNELITDEKSVSRAQASASTRSPSICSKLPA